MKKQISTHSLKINTILNVVSTSSTALMTMIIVPYVSRVLSVEGNGAVSYVQSVAGWFLTFSLPGIALYGVRECARVRDDEKKLATIVSELLIIVSACTIVSSIVFSISILIIPAFADSAPLMWVFLFGNVLSSYGVEWFYQAIEQYVYITIRNIAVKALSIICIFLFVNNESDYFAYGCIIALLSASNNLFNILRLKQLIDFSLVHSMNPIRHIKPLFQFAITKISTTAMTSLDTVLLGLLTVGTYQVGLYQFSIKIKNLFNAGIQAVTSAMIPRVSYEDSKGNTERRIDIWHKSFIIVFNISSSISLYLLIFSEHIICFIVSKKFLDAALTLRITGIILLIMAMNYMLGEIILIPMKMEQITKKANLIGAVICIVFGCLLDSKFGSIGAAISVLIAELIITAILFYNSRIFIKQIHCFKDCKKIIYSLILTFAFNYYVVNNYIPASWSSTIVIILSCFTFWLFYLITLLLFKEELALYALKLIKRAK